MAGGFSLSGYDTKAADMVKKAEQLQASYNENLSYATYGDRARDLAIATDMLGFLPNSKGKQDRYYEEMVGLLDKSPWTSTQIQGFACMATGRYLMRNKGMSQEVQATLSGLKAGVKNLRQQASASVEIPIDKSDFGKKITVQNEGKSPVYIHQTDVFTDNTLKVNATSSRLTLKMEVYNVTRKKTGTDDVKLGDELKITLKITNPSPFTLSNMALNLIVPSGLKLNNQRISRSGTEEGSNNEWYQDFRDDRVQTFFELAGGKKVQHTFSVRAAFAGDFYWPSAHCENMYRGDVSASTASGRLVIRD
jgi:uncharacterized protein YfaS (alpha-2-macroglobulin family)